MKKALRIDAEGCDGAGKTTGLKYLIGLLQAAGKTVLETREVGNPHIPVCVKLREVVLSPDSNLSGEAMELIFAAMRLANEDFYKKNEENFDFIVSDRGWLSHVAYGDHNTSERFTTDLFYGIISNMTPAPNIVVYFNVSSETALKRRIKRGTSDIIEMKGPAFQDKVRASFEDHMECLDGVSHIFTVDANGTIEDVQAQLREIALRIQLLSESHSHQQSVNG